MTFDAGRIRHDGALMHYSRASNGSSIPSNWRLSATGDTGVAWAPESASSVSYASNSNDVGNADAAGASSLVSPADHVHRGVHLLSSNGSNSLYGDVNLQAGSGIALGVAAQSITITNTGSAGGGGGGTTITTKDEGTTLSSAVTTLDFVGAGVTASGAGATTTVTISGGGSGLTMPTVRQCVLAGNAATSITITAASSGHSLLLFTNSTTGQVTSPTCTNVTFTQVKTFTSAGSSFYALWVGVVAGGSSGTSLTMTKPGSFNTAIVMEVDDALTPTLGQSSATQILAPAVNVTNFARISGQTSGRLIVLASGIDNTVNLATFFPGLPVVGVNRATGCAIAVGYATSAPVTISSDANAGAAFICELS